MNESRTEGSVETGEVGKLDLNRINGSDDTEVRRNAVVKNF